MVKPIVQAFLLADHVYQDIGTRKMIIAGCFNRVIRASSHEKKEQAESNTVQPICVAGSPYVYLNLVSAKVPQSLELRWVDLSDNRVLLGANIDVPPPEDPLDSIELVVPMPQLPFPHAGVFALELLVKDEPLASWRVTCVDPPDEESKK